MNVLKLCTLSCALDKSPWEGVLAMKPCSLCKVFQSSALLKLMPNHVWFILGDCDWFKTICRSWPCLWVVGDCFQSWYGVNEGSLRSITFNITWSSTSAAQLLLKREIFPLSTYIMASMLGLLSLSEVSAECVTGFIVWTSRKQLTYVWEMGLP